MSQRLSMLAAACLLSGTAFANEPVATLGQAQGTVLVSQGDQFVTATDGQALQAGDRVLVMEGGSVQLSFSDGCALPLAAGSMLDVPALSPCAGGVASVQRVGPLLAQADAEPANAESADAEPTDTTTAKSNTNTWLLVGGGVVAIALVAGGGSDSNDRPVSP